MKDLDEKFSLIEERIRTLVARNKSLADRVQELEKELTSARREVLVEEHKRGKNQEIREKIENILHALDSLSAKKND